MYLIQLKDLLNTSGIFSLLYLSSMYAIYRLVFLFHSFFFFWCILKRALLIKNKLVGCLVSWRLTILFLSLSLVFFSRLFHRILWCSSWSIGAWCDNTVFFLNIRLADILSSLPFFSFFLIWKKTENFLNLILFNL